MDVEAGIRSLKSETWSNIAISYSSASANIKSIMALVAKQTDKSIMLTIDSGAKASELYLKLAVYAESRRTFSPSSSRKLNTSGSFKNIERSHSSQILNTKSNGVRVLGLIPSLSANDLLESERRALSQLSLQGLKSSESSTNFINQQASSTTHISKLAEAKIIEGYVVVYITVGDLAPNQAIFLTDLFNASFEIKGNKFLNNAKYLIVFSTTAGRSVFRAAARCAISINEATSPSTSYSQNFQTRSTLRPQILFENVFMSYDIIDYISNILAVLKCQNMVLLRGGGYAQLIINIKHASKLVAANAGIEFVTHEHVHEALVLCLRHRVHQTNGQVTEFDVEMLVKHVSCN